MDERHERGQPAVVGAGRAATEARDQLPVAAGQAVEVPRPVQQVLGRDQVAGLSAEDRGPVGELELCQHGTGDDLPVGMRGDGCCRSQEAEPGEGQPAPQLVAFGPLVLGHGAEHDHPPSVPTPRR
jgi:hypothetical protein